MPYRRLPNTDQARIRALQLAIEKAGSADFNDQVLPYKLVSEEQRLYALFRTNVVQKNDNFDTKVTVNRQYRQKFQKARMYISHFIQVLNLSVIRGEIKKNQKELYGLDPDLHIVPEMASDQDLLAWGEKIIQGEIKRTSQGGYPIYNPNINKVKVYFDIFKEQQVNHSFQANTTERLNGNVESMRDQVDRVILEIWNLVEEHYKNLYPYDKLQHCKAYGMIYYYRTGEARITLETDRRLREAERSQTTLQWSD